ncbi:MAG: metalloregulator ArsR/SmtB family transcription factor [Capsulimonadales bacterium]|nr:metalloregulator ArsR/SmtB family transcription factor [Capsulimonadales bacterium]
MAKQKKRQIEGAENAQAIADAAERFRALGDPTRLAILGYLIVCETQEPASETAAEGEAGVTIGEIARFLTGDKEITSGISHHIKELRQAGLIRVERDGKKKRCRLNRETLLGLAGRLALPDRTATAPDSPAAEGETVPVPDVVPDVDPEATGEATPPEPAGNAGRPPRNGRRTTPKRPTDSAG